MPCDPLCTTHSPWPPSRIARVVAPGVTPDVGALIRTPGRHFKEHYGQLALWATGLLVFACLLALFAALIASRQNLSPPAWLTWLFSKGGVGKEPALVGPVRSKS